MAVEYIVRGAKMKCIWGSNSRKINLPVSHGSYVKFKDCGTEKPILNADDKTEENISYFGVCEHGKEDELIDVIDDNGQLICSKKKCKLEIDNCEWLLTKDDYLVDNKPALTTESIMFTNCGGIIIFKTSGQND